MASNHIYFTQNSQHGIIKRNALSGLESGVKGLKDTIGAMTQMLEGDGSADAHYPTIVTRYGYESNTKAREAYNELNSLSFQLDGINAALVQAFNKFR